MRTLLEQRLHSAGLSFSAWTILAYTNVSPVSAEQVVQYQVGGHAVPDAYEAQKSIDSLVSAGLIVANQGGTLTHTVKGKEVFKPLSDEIEDITRALYGDLPTADLDITHRTLMEISKRANKLLAQTNPRL